MTFECTVKKGHAGAGKYNEVKILINANDIITAMNIAKSSGGVKKGRAYDAGQSIISIRQVN
jgi:hypothetical protein